jgi:hypothetical protein
MIKEIRKVLQIQLVWPMTSLMVLKFSHTYVLLISLDTNFLIDSWVLDSTSSYHTCPNR